MHYAGVDLHKQSITICVLDEDRKVVRRKRLLCCNENLILAFFQNLGQFEVAVEATSGYEWFAKLLEPLDCRFVLAEPNRLKKMMDSRFKSDRLDAHKIATVLAEGYMPQAYIPTDRQREHRGLVRHRCRLQRRITSLKAQLRNLASRYNADRTDLFTRGWVEFKKVKLSLADRFVRDQLWAQLQFMTRQLCAANKKLGRFADKAPALERERRVLLQTIPGVGFVTAEVVLCEIGDPERFRSIGRLSSYAGLAPGRHESAGRQKELPITKAGSRLLRWVMIEAAWQTIRYSRRWRCEFERIAKRRGRKKAIVAIARRLLGVMHTMMLTGKPYDPLYVPMRCAPDAAAQCCASPPSRGRQTATAAQEGKNDHRPSISSVN